MPELFYHGQNDYIDKLNSVAYGREAYYVGNWAGRPLPNTVPIGTVIIVTDIGLGNRSWWWSDGTNWRPFGGSVVLARDDISTISYTNTSPDVVAGWEYDIPAGMMYTGSAVRTMCRAYRNTGAVGTWLFAVNFMNAAAGTYPTGNYAAHYGTTSTSLLYGQALGLINMTAGGVQRTGGWGYAWSGGASNAVSSIQPISTQNPGPGDPVKLFLMGSVPASSQGTFSDVLVEFIG